MGYRITTDLVDSGLRPPSMTFPVVQFQITLGFSTGETYGFGVNNQVGSLNISDNEYITENIPMSENIEVRLTPALVSEKTSVTVSMRYFVDNEELEVSQVFLLDPFDISTDDTIRLQELFTLDGAIADNTNIYLDLKVHPPIVEEESITELGAYVPIRDLLSSDEVIVRDAFTFEPNLDLATAFQHDFISSSADEYTVDVAFETTSSIMFSTAYGHYTGLGASETVTGSGISANTAIYSGIKSIVGQENLTKLNFFNTDYNDVYVVSLGNLKSDYLDNRTFELNLKALNGDVINEAVHTGSNINVSPAGEVLSVIPDSGSVEKQSGITVTKLLSGSMANGAEGTATTLGFLLAEANIALLLPAELDSLINFNTVRLNQNGDNAEKLYVSMKGADDFNNKGVLTFGKRSIKEFGYICDIDPSRHNYSLNPSFSKGTSGSFVTGSSSPREGYGRMKYESVPEDGYSCIDSPFSYITSIGLYDDDKNLIGVGKLSCPVRKTDDVQFTVIVRIPDETQTEV